MRIWGVATSCACVIGLALPGTAVAGWGAAEHVEKNINQVLLAPGGPGYVVGFRAESPKRLRFAIRPLAAEAAQVARAAGVRKLVLIHLNPRLDEAALLQEATGVFAETAIGKDLMPLLQTRP